MLVRATQIAIFLLFVIPGPVQATNIHISVEPKSTIDWRVEYAMLPAVTSLVFIRSFTDYRSETWIPDNSEFVVERFGNVDRIRRVDGQPFDEFAANIIPYTEKPPVGYSPFVKFSDGAMAVFTGQFAVGLPVSDNPDHFANGIANGNTIAAEIQTLAVDPGPFKRMIAHASIVERYETRQLAEGTYLYLGETETSENESLIAVTDPATPAWLRDYLFESMVATYEYLSFRLGSLGEEKPFLITALRQRDDNYVQASGGVLDNQVVMDIALNLELKNTESMRTFFVRFFAHESAHLWHRGGRIPAGGPGSWVHEGSADALAWLALQEVGIYTPENALDLFETAANDCAEHLALGVISDASRRNAHAAHYDCGAVIALATHGIMRQQGRDLFDFWRTILNAGTGPDDFRVDYYYFELARMQPGFDDVLIHFVEALHDDAPAAVTNLLGLADINTETNDDGNIRIFAIP